MHRVALTIAHDFVGLYVEGPREVVEPGGGACESSGRYCPGPAGAVKSGFFPSRSPVSSTGLAVRGALQVPCFSQGLKASQG